MKNTLENKAKFFAQYWGQELFEWIYPQHAIKEGVLEKYPNLEKYTQCIFLNLKPLSQISDEDAKNICRLITSSFSDDSIASVQGRKLINHFRTQSNLWGEDWVKIIDYLRSKGYALPWNEITVEEQIEFGWIKLKKL